MYHPNSTSDEKNLLKKIGVSSFEDLLPRLPKNHLNPGLGLRKNLSEMDLSREMEGLAGKNGSPLSFVGAGAYDHFIPAAVPAIQSRGEFLTAYTPYQAEASQGTLQSIFEFQSIVAEIYGMDMANASMYDGATSLAEAVLVAVRQTGKPVVILPDALHPHYRRTLETYFGSNPGIQLATVPCPHGVIDSKELDMKLSANKDKVAAVVIQSPNFFGCIEDGAEWTQKAHAAGALSIVSANPLAMGLLTPPGEYGADIAVGDGQPLGIPLSFGGPYVGLFACKQELMRKIPGRLCGKTVDTNGQVGYVLTLQAREQHIRREKAISNICSNQNLMALAVTLQSSLLGPEGLRDLAELNLQQAHYAASQISNIPGFKLHFSAPFFNEFVLELSGDAELFQQKALAMNVLPGLILKPYFPSLDRHILVNVTEKRSKEDIDRLVSVLRSVK